MDEKIAAAPKQVLVEIVKLAQKRGMEGAKGGWKQFLNFHDRKHGASLSDPGRRSSEVLVAFLKTFSEEKDLKFFVRAMRCYSNFDAVEQFKNKAPDNESPELRLVRLTLDHPMYPSDYFFPSYEEEWVITKLSRKSKTLRSTEMVAVDCEMVLCEDGSDALVKVCVVDRNLQVKLDEIVKPSKPVVDYRTEITGITAKDLDGVTCSLADVQKSMKKLLSHGTILVGHSLNNDLLALKLDHARVIDTSLIFKFLNGTTYRRPSLNNLCKSILGQEVRTPGAPHNCLDDACAAMKLVLAKLEHGFDSDVYLIHEDVAEIERAKLLIHRIPVTVAVEQLHNIIPGNFAVEIQSKKKGHGGYYSAIAIFKNPEEANEVFERIAGNEDKDSFGLAQKVVSFRLETGVIYNLYVRKMTRDCSPGEKSLKKRKVEADEAIEKSKKSRKDKFEADETLEKSKKSKEDENVEEVMQSRTDSNLCDDHVKEIESLKKLLGQRDFEIATLHKIITSLTRKQGL